MVRLVEAVLARRNSAASRRVSDGGRAQGKPRSAWHGSRRRTAGRHTGSVYSLSDPIYDETGKLIGAVNMLVDITDRKRAEEQQALLVRELHHRVKNTLATVQAIMGSTARVVDNIEDFKTALFGRIQSLSKTHLLLADEERAAEFVELLRSELDAFDDGSNGRISLQGPQVTLSSQLAVSLGMAIHELTTNAAKYGALSVFGGKVEVTWSVTIDATRRTLAFDWIESGGPPVGEPTRKGFGTRLLEFVLPGQIQAKTKIVYGREGLRMHCVVPLPSGQI